MRIFGGLYIQVGVGLSWIDMQRGASHIVCTPLAGKITQPSNVYKHTIFGCFTVVDVLP